MTDEEKQRYQRAYARQNSRYERNGAIHFHKAIKLSIKDITAYSVQYGPAAALLVVDSMVKRKVIENAFIDFYLYVGKAHKLWCDKEHLKRIVIPFQERKKERGLPSVAVGSADAGFGLNFFNPEWLQRLKRLVYSLEVGKRVSSVTDTIRNKLRNVLGRAVKEEVRPSVMARRMQDEMGGVWSAQRAKLIARTETTRVANVATKESAMEAVKGLGILLDKIWIDTLDDRTRDTHKENPDPIPAEDKFMVGGKLMEFPGDPEGGAEECCNCRCTHAYTPRAERPEILPNPYYQYPLPNINFNK